MRLPRTRANRMSALARSLLVASVAGLALFVSAPVRARVDVDRPVPELDFKLLNGKTLKAADLHGKVVVQMYWATWCPYCRSDLPELQRLYEAYRSKGLEIVALSIDEEEKTVRDFWKDKHYSFPVGMRSDAIFDHYGRVSTTPTYYIVDRQGIVRHRFLGSPEPGVIEQLVLKLLQ
jgi:cytochrome c biogenesis protein CcmG/thiol:disulfide interchange protein DsbE